jgi:hypothetical protein
MTSESRKSNNRIQKRDVVGQNSEYESEYDSEYDSETM